MPNNADHIAQLIIKQLNDAITDAEKAELQAWMDGSENNQQIAEQFLVDENLLTGIQETFHADEKIWNRVNESISHQPAKVRTMRPWKWVAAAVIVFVVGGLWFVVSQTLRQAQGDKTEMAKTNDVPAPNRARAMITLADGTKVYLDSVGMGHWRHKEVQILLRVQMAKSFIATKERRNKVNWYTTRFPIQEAVR